MKTIKFHYTLGTKVTLKEMYSIFWKNREYDFFRNLNRYGIGNYDYIGLSYYPYWAGPYEKFIENARNAYHVFGKKVIIAETAFPYTDVSNDDTPNVVTGELTRNTMNMDATPENQFLALKKIVDIAKSEEFSFGFKICYKKY